MVRLIDGKDAFDEDLLCGNVVGTGDAGAASYKERGRVKFQKVHVHTPITAAAKKEIARLCLQLLA